MALSEVLERGGVVVDNDGDEHQRVNEILEDREVAGEDICKLSVEKRYEHCGDHRAVDATHTAENHDDEYLDRVVVVKGLAGYVELGVAVEHACKSRKNCGENKSEKLVAGHVDAGCLCGDLVVTDCGYRTSVLASNEVLYNEERYQNDGEADYVKGRLVISGCFKSHGTAKGFLARILEDRSHYLAECERGDRQIVTSESERGQTDEKSANTCACTAHEERDEEREDTVAKRSNENGGDLTAEVSTDTHKARVSERELSKEAYHKAE